MKDLLQKHSRELQWIANALLERETLTGEEVKVVVRGDRLPRPKA